MDYREPITLKNVRESGGVFGVHREHNEVMAEIDITTEKGKRDMHMLQNGLACANCYTTFPARPGPDTLSEFEGTFNLFPISIETQRDRIKDGSCNLCGFRATNENIEKMIMEEAMQMARSMYDELGDER